MSPDPAVVGFRDRALQRELRAAEEHEARVVRALSVGASRSEREQRQAAARQHLQWQWAQKRTELQGALDDARAALGHGRARMENARAAGALNAAAAAVEVAGLETLVELAERDLAQHIGQQP